ncbi:MAG: 4Fe-4S binding protein, partial [Bacteroidales bacterium]
QELCHSCGACLAACPEGAVREHPVSLGKVTTYTLNEWAEIAEAKMRIGVMSPVPVIKEAIRHINDKAEIVILDAPPGNSCPFVHTVNSADFVVMITEPTPFGLSDLKQSIETLRELNKPFGVVVNRAGTGNNDIYKYLKENDILLLAEIPFSMDIARLYSEGIVAAEKIPSLRRQFLQVADTLEQINGNSSYQR